MKRTLCFLGTLLGCLGSSCAAEAALTTHDQLQAGVVAWVAQQQGLKESEISMAPLDHRLRLKPCEAPLTHEFPFPSAETVKVVCKKPNWHVFVRMTLPTPNAKVRSASVAVTPSTAAVPVPAAPLRPVWVVEQHVSAGSSVQTRQLVLVERPSADVGPQALDSQTDLTHMEAVRDLAPGTIVRQYDLRSKTLIKRGQMVQIMIGQSSGFQISARVEAQQDGRYGESIKLKNPESGRILSGVVKGPGLVSGS